LFPSVTLFQNFSIPTYLLVISTIYSFGVIWVFLKAKNNSYSTHTALDLFFLIMIGGFVGSRLFHVFYEEPQYYLKNPIEILYFWQGGFVFFGGALTVIILGVIFLQKNHIQKAIWFDFFTPICAVGYSLGRLSCFLNGCCYGKSTTLPWGVIFPSHQLIRRHPTQLYAALWEASVCILLFSIESWRKKKYSNNHFLL
jgi:phosphatidylglycerol---prolipoprotein diacylglyceryl transferase